MDSKIIQIVVSGGNEATFDVLYALCADGTLWRKVEDGEQGNVWRTVSLESE